MRQIKAFSSNLRFINQESERKSFSDTMIAKDSKGEVTTYMTPSLVKMSIREMKRPINQRFLQLIKSCKSFSKSVRDVEDLAYLRKFMVMQLTMMLGEYVAVLDNTPSLNLSNYFRVNSVLPNSKEISKKLSRTIIMANKVKRVSGILPPKNQRDLNRIMDEFMNSIVDETIGNNKLNLNSPL